MPLTAKQQQFLNAWILGNQSRSVFTKARQTIGGSVESEAKEFSKKRGKALAAIGALGDDMAQVKADLQGRMDVIDAGADLGYFKNQMKLLERIVTDAADARTRQDQFDGQQAALERLVKASAGKGKGRPDGAIVSYSAELKELASRTAYFVDRIFKGARPGDLPIEQPTKYELTVNLKAARTIGLTVPSAILLRADRVINE